MLELEIFFWSSSFPTKYWLLQKINYLYNNEKLPEKIIITRK